MKVSIRLSRTGSLASGKTTVQSIIKVYTKPSSRDLKYIDQDVLEKNNKLK